jgi:DNA-binding transcriptional ArsR family regulator/precorrin-6B methylase 2
MKTVDTSPVRSLKALSDETRLRILRLLDDEELNVNEIREVLGMSQSRISHHLAVLREAGLIRDRREGTWVFYSAAAADARRDGFMLEGLRERWHELPGFDEDRRGLQRALARRAERSRRHFDERPDSWAVFQERSCDAALRPIALARLVDRKRLLVDVGTGAGFLLSQLSSCAERVIGVDHSRQMLRKARERAAREGLANVEFREGDLENLPIEDESADGAFAVLVLHHAPRPSTAVRELTRACRPGGRVVVVDFLPHSEEWLREEHADLRLGFEPDEVRAWFHGAGLEDFLLETWPFSRLDPEDSDSAAAGLQVFVASGTKPETNEESPRRWISRGSDRNRGEGAKASSPQKKKPKPRRSAR